MKVLQCGPSIARTSFAFCTPNARYLLLGMVQQVVSTRAGVPAQRAQHIDYGPSVQLVRRKTALGIDRLMITAAPPNPPPASNAHLPTA